MTNQTDLHETLEKAAQTLALAAPDVPEWRGWVIYFLKSLDNLTQENENQLEFEILLFQIVEEIRSRLELEHW